jgi:hypothetical protein
MPFQVVSYRENEWDQVCRDKALADLPYKIELDKYGKLIMSPAHKKTPSSKLKSNATS